MVLWVVVLGKAEVAGQPGEAVGLTSQVGAARAAGVVTTPSGRMATAISLCARLHAAASTGMPAVL